MSDMLDSAWLAIKTKTQKSEPVLLASSVELLQKDVSNLLVTGSFFLAAETIQHTCIPILGQLLSNVMVHKRRAEVNVSALSAEQIRELEKGKTQGTIEPDLGGTGQPANGAGIEDLANTMKLE